MTKMTNKEAISNLELIYGIVSSDIQRSLDLAIKALEREEDLVNDSQSLVKDLVKENNERPDSDGYTDFLNAIERVAEEHGWNIDIASNFSDEESYPRIEITFGHAIGEDSKNRRF